MPAPYERLEWDSDVFGFGVARIDPTLLGDAGELEPTVHSLRAAGFRLAYLFLPPESPRELHRAACAVGGVAVGSRVVFRSALDGAPPTPDPAGVITPYEPDVVTPELVALARQAGQHSRFLADPRVGTAVFRRIYDAWIQRSVAREIADVVLVALDAERTVGLVTARVDADGSDIGLLAVDAAFRGRGIGASLVRAVHARARERHARSARVVTQGENLHACALYARLGYTISETQAVFHIWT